jgi:hypothetical protein
MEEELAYSFWSAGVTRQSQSILAWTRLNFEAPHRTSCASKHNNIIRLKPGKRLEEKVLIMIPSTNEYKIRRYS